MAGKWLDPWKYWGLKRGPGQSLIPQPRWEVTGDRKELGFAKPHCPLPLRTFSLATCLYISLRTWPARSDSQPLAGLRPGSFPAPLQSNITMATSHWLQGYVWQVLNRAWYMGAQQMGGSCRLLQGGDQTGGLSPLPSELDHTGPSLCKRQA